DKGRYLKQAIGSFLEKPSKQVELEEFFQADKRINLEAKMLPDDLPAEIYIPFVSNEFICAIFLGHRYSHVKVQVDELPFITFASSQLAQRLITSFVIKELSKEIKELAQRSLNSHRRNQGLQGITTSLFKRLEKERKTIAYEIHDGPLQLGLDLNRWLKYLVDERPTNTKTIKAISHMRELVENLNFELRLICNDLRPPSLTDLGLLPSIELMCEEVMLKELLIISLEVVGINREERFKEEVELAAYRFLQEGISNALKHSGSNKLKFHIEMSESGLELTVRDSGKGFDTSKIDDWSLTGAHFGIVGMNERFKSLGGDLKVSSTIGRGTMLKATIPIRFLTNTESATFENQRISMGGGR
ncbi:ATP-binding protein, partial [Desulfosporosinus sp. OT]|uniref:sensor histidine kinase n=1 Tax=Desulfosporosinus sp. OT TaxID=913865 RepID=UPI000223A595